MKADDFEETWRDLNTEMLTEMTSWRKQHPRATLQEIEQAVDQHINAARARLLEQVAQASPAADWRSEPPEHHPTCPTCATPLRPNGTYSRHLQTQGDQPLSLERTYGRCPRCGTGLFPPG